MALISQLSRTGGMGSSAFHTGLVVADLDAAMAELHNAFGVTWREPGLADFTADSPDGPMHMVCRFVYSVEGPPYIELGEFDRGLSSPRSMPVGATHIGFWSDDVVDDERRFQQAGMSLLFRVPGAGDGSPLATFHLGHGGLVVEVVGRELMSSIVGETS
jgi:hypothetical protein